MSLTQGIKDYALDLGYAHNYIRETRYFRRNAAIALGNSGDPAFVPALARAVEDPEELIRSYAAWALGRTGGAKAGSVFASRLAGERAQAVIGEIEAALASG